MQEMWKTRVQSLGREDPLKKEMATHSSILAWKTPWTEEPEVYSPWGCKESDMTQWLNNNKKKVRLREGNFPEDTQWKMAEPGFEP